MKAAILALVLAVAGLYVGGALLYQQQAEIGRANSNFICTFGHAITTTPLAPRAAETNEEFRHRVQTTKKFVSDLANELDDCKEPAVVVVDPEARPHRHP